MNNTLKKIILFPMNILYKVNPKLELSLMFLLKNGYKMNWENPVTYRQKLQWIKLYDKNQLMPICADKYEVRRFVEDCGCKEILNELLWEGFDPKEISFNKLPKQFVIKTTHGSGFNIICKNKYEFNRAKAIKKLSKWLKEKYIPCYGEWFYGAIKPRIIIEKFLSEDNFKIPIDYKVMCFNGEPKYIMVHTGKFINKKINMYDLNWKCIECNIDGFDKAKPMEKPDKLEEILEYSRKLSRQFYHARVDFYIINNRVYFGEITFTNGAGFDKLTPYSFDVEMGNWIKLSNREFEGG